MDKEIIIRISQEDYEAIKDGSIVGDMTIPYVFEAIRNGTPLPKHHGRLIDADALSARMEQRVNEVGDDRAIWEASGVETALDMYAPTIIEADKESDD